MRVLMFVIPQFGHLPFNHPSDQLSWRTPLAIVISLDRTLSLNEAQWDSHFWLSSKQSERSRATKRMSS